MRGGRAPAAPDHDHRREQRGVLIALDARQREGRADVQGGPPRPRTAAGGAEAPHDEPAARTRLTPRITVNTLPAGPARGRPENQNQQGAKTKVSRSRNPESAVRINQERPFRYSRDIRDRDAFGSGVKRASARSSGVARSPPRLGSQSGINLPSLRNTVHRGEPWHHEHIWRWPALAC